MKKNLSKILFLCFQLTLCSTFFLFSTIKLSTAQPPPVWWNKDWLSVTPVNLTETFGIERTSELVDVHIEFEPGTCKEPNKEIRVVFFDGSSFVDVTSQVYNLTKEDDYAESCNVVFLADCPAYGNVTYYVYYNPSIPASIPEYDGLRLHVELAGDTYNITALIDGVEKNYSRLLFKHLMDLYSDGKLVCWPGGPAGWEFAQITLASLWSDGAYNPWFSVGDIVTVANSGPLFVEFNITQPIASDLWSTVFNYNVSTTYMVRVYYQPDLTPLVGYHMSINFNQTDIVKDPVVVDFKLANSTSYEIYQDFTWKNQDQEITTVSAKDDMPQIDSIWSAAKPYGWLSYNGSIPGMPDRPAANIGLIPTYAGGTNPSVNYVVNFTATYSDTPMEAYFDHHCTTQLSAVTNGVKGDVIESKGFIKVYPPAENADPAVSEIAAELRHLESLQTKVGEPYTIELVDRRAPTITGIVPAMAGQEIVEKAEVNLEATVTDDTAIILETLIIQESGVDKVFLHYSIDGGKTWNVTDMTKIEETDVYDATIPGFKSGTKVSYIISATDKNGNEETSPTYWYKVRIPSQTGMWLGIGIAIGFITAIVIAAAAFYIRKKP